MNLIIFESCLDRQSEVCFNPLVDVIATQEIPNAKRTSNDCHINNFLRKQVQEIKKEAKKQNDKSNE